MFLFPNGIAGRGSGLMYQIKGVFCSLCRLALAEGRDLLSNLVIYPILMGQL